MKIGVISDSHDQVWNLRVALKALNGEADLLIHCGDLCSPFIVPMLAQDFDGPVHAVFGNNDADRFRIERLAAKSGQVQIEGEAWLTGIEGVKIAVQHFDDLARPLAESGRYDLVCFGHNHRLEVDRVGDSWLINPGAIMGYAPGAGSDVEPTFVVFDTDIGEPTIWRIVNGVASRDASSGARSSTPPATR
jgi:putative phosphoesterase